MTAQENDISTAMKELRFIITNMERNIRDKFKENFDKVVINFEHSFRELFEVVTLNLDLKMKAILFHRALRLSHSHRARSPNINLMSGERRL